MTDKILVDRSTIQQVSDWFKWFHAGNTLEAVWSSKQCSRELRAALDQPALAQQPAVPPGYKLLKNSTHAERSWPEDASHENGSYHCTCVNCGREFVGFKRRVVCRVCDAMLNAAPEAPAAQNDRDAQEAPFEQWWEKHGQFCRAGGGEYEKTFAWNAWCAAAQKEQP